MHGRTLMVQGTMSSVGKSIMVAALCRIFKQDGLRVAPFKSQNMALNSYATYDGREIGRAQAMQAAAAGIEVTVEMNPILVKPEADSFAQIIVLGKPWERLPAREYVQRRGVLWETVTRALDTLRATYDLVIIEGAGSPVELNLKGSELVNMSIATHADAPVLLVGDIDRGGIFAQLLGTLSLLEAEERARVQGLIINKFRGDTRLFDDGVTMMQERGGVPVLGVLPFIRDLRLPDEDSVALDERRITHTHTSASLDIAVIRLPHISNFDDFDPLRAEPDVSVRFVTHADDLAQPDLIILPGTKTTIDDLAYLWSRGLAEAIIGRARTGTPILGICGGYQMLGATLSDPLGIEAHTPNVPGLGLLAVATTFFAEKHTLRAHGQIVANSGLFAGARGFEIRGYEIHMGHTLPLAEALPTAPGEEVALIRVRGRGQQTSIGTTESNDGTIGYNGWVAGTYFHGLFDNDLLRARLLANLAARRGLVRSLPVLHFDRERGYEQLAQIVREHLNVEAIYRLIS